MLKEVGSSGQISLGKRFAGQLFDVQFLETGEVSMKPVRVVPAMTEAKVERASGAKEVAKDDSWHATHAKQIAAYNAWAEQGPTFSDSVRQWREAQPSQGSDA